MSLPGENARSPAPRRIRQRSVSSADSASTVSPRRFHIGLVSALSFSGRFSTTVAIGPSRSTRIVEKVGLVDRLRDGEIGVVADEVHQLAGAHAEAGRAQAGVQHLRLRRLLQQQRQRLGVIGARNAVDDEAGRGACVHWHLAPGLGQLEDGLRHFGLGMQA